MQNGSHQALDFCGAVLIQSEGEFVWLHMLSSSQSMIHLYTACLNQFRQELSFLIHFFHLCKASKGHSRVACSFWSSGMNSTEQSKYHPTPLPAQIVLAKPQKQRKNTKILVLHSLIHMLSNVLRAGCSNAALSVATPLQSDFQGNDLPIPSSWTHPGPSWVRKAKLETTKKTYANDAKGRPTNQSKAQQLEEKKAKIKQMPGNVIHFILHKSIKFYLHPNDVHAALPC